MNIIDIITKKKNKQVLSYEELMYAFNGYLNNKIKLNDERKKGGKKERGDRISKKKNIK